MLNKVIIMGRLCADPDFRTTQSGVSVCRIRVAVNRQYQKDKEQQADFINCTCWRGTADFVGKYFHKGSLIIIEGSLRNNDYTDQNGVKRYGMDVQVENASFGESKNSAQSVLNAPQQPAQSTRQTTCAAPQATSVPDVLCDLGDFEEILGDGEPPF